VSARPIAVFLLHPFGDSCKAVESAAQSSFALDSLPSTARKRIIAGIPVLTTGANRSDPFKALSVSCAELSTLSRNIYHLTHLLRQAEVGPALYYRDMLDTLSGDVRRHLALASGVLADLRPCHQPPSKRRP